MDEEARNLLDEGWFAAIYRRRYEDVYKYAVRRVGPESARDVAAEVFLVLWRRSTSLEEADELAYLYGVARKVTANLLRSRRRRGALIQRVSSALAAGVAQQLDPMGAVDAAVVVRAAVAQLPARDQEALLLVEWEDVDMATGGRIAGCSAKTFAVRVHRARRRLAELLGEADRSGRALGVVGDLGGTR